MAFQTEPVYVQIVIFISYFTTVNCTRASTHLLVTRVGPCYEPQVTVIKVSELRITTQSYDSTLSGVIHISEDISNGWKTKATMQKCVDIRNRDSCDFFKSFFVVKNGCGGDGSQQNLYSALFNFTIPKMKCPVQAGRYELRNYPFHSEDNYVSVFESKISTSVFGFTFRLDGFSHDQKKIFCVETYLQLLYKRNHNWIKSANDRVTTTLPTTEQTTVQNEDY